jgi:transcriptional regulator with XRE-family HTH domain
MRASGKPSLNENLSLQRFKTADLHLGQRLRQRRLVLGISQQTLADAVGITFQQIQKYEKGLSRVSASRLRELGDLLDVPLSFFFEGSAIPTRVQITPAVELTTAIDSDSSQLPDLTHEGETLSLLRSYYRIPQTELRKKMRGLIASVANHCQKAQVAIPIVRLIGRPIDRAEAAECHDTIAPNSEVRSARVSEVADPVQQETLA